jgi:site-specific DNA recombinase
LAARADLASSEKGGGVGGDMAEKTDIKRVAGYVRVSTPGQAEDGESPHTQESEIKDYAEKRGWELVNIYEDLGISGAKAEKRPGFMTLIRDAENKEFDAVIFTRLSRFARNAGDFLHYRDKLSKHGIMLLSIKEGIDPTTHTGKLMMGLLALIAEWEREIIRENMSENKMIKWRENRMFNGKAPYAYRWNKDLHKLEIVSEEADTYMRIISLYLNQGLSFKDIVIQLNDEGLKCKKAPWSSAVISYMFKNPIYYGHYVTNKFKYIEGKRSKENKPTTEHIEYRDVPAIISKDVWDRLQSKIAFNKVKSKRTDWTKDYFLRDLLICGRCGRKVSAHAGSVKKSGERYRYYSCYLAGTSQKKAREMRADKCTLQYINADEIEGKVWTLLMMVLGGTKYKFIEKAFGVDNIETTTKNLQRQLKTLEMELTRKNTARAKLYDLLEKPATDINEVTEKLIDNKDTILSLMARIEEAKNQLQNSLDALEQFEAIRNFAKDKTLQKKLHTELSKLEPADKKSLLEGLIDGKIKVDTDAIDITEELPEEEVTPGPEPKWLEDRHRYLKSLNLSYKYRWNSEVFQQLIKKGKISIFNNNGR